MTGRSFHDNSPCFIYVIGREDGPVKIGISGSPNGRLASIQTGCPFRISILHIEEMRDRDHALEHEDHIHRLFAENRLVGEWFDLDPDLAIEQVEFSLELEQIFKEREMANGPHA
jgi:hypothetical protein